MKPTADKKNVYQIVTDAILAQLDKGVIPWRKPWTLTGGARNIKGNVYRGVNQFLLQIVAMEKGYKHPVWLTFNQAKAQGGCVRKGEKGTPVIFWKILKKEEQKPDGSTEDKSFAMLRYYTVFNVEQCDGVKVPETVTKPANEKIMECETVASKYFEATNAPMLRHGGDRACYIPGEDRVCMPNMSDFKTSAHYYSTLFHEMVHSTGAKGRLARKGVTDLDSFGSHQYGQEELVAEFGAAFLNGVTGLDPVTIESNAAYIDHWRKAAKVDEKLMVMACAQAQKAADFILKVDGDEAEGDEE